MSKRDNRSHFLSNNSVALCPRSERRGLCSLCHSVAAARNIVKLDLNSYHHTILFQLLHSESCFLIVTLPGVVVENTSYFIISKNSGVSHIIMSTLLYVTVILIHAILPDHRYITQLQFSLRNHNH